MWQEKQQSSWMAPRHGRRLGSSAVLLTSCDMYLGVITDFPLSSCSTSMKLTRKSSSASAGVREGATI